MLGMAGLFFGDSICSMMKMPVPDLLKQAQENRMMTFGVVFVVNNMAQSLVNSGAFEISFNGKQIFSKLQEGRLPQPDELVELLSAASR
jgi:selT/selW/selH-like putative selenoprotein